MTRELIADLERARPALPRAGLRAFLPALLALRHAAPLLRDLELVHRAPPQVQGADARQQRADRLAPGARQARPLRQMAGEQRRLGALARPLLGHAAAGLALPRRRLRRTCTASARSRSCASAPGARSRTTSTGPTSTRSSLDCEQVRRRDAPRRLGDRHLVRQRRHALRPVPLPVRERGGVRRALPGRLHLRGPGPDPRLVLHPAGRVDAAVRRVELPQLRLPRADPRPRGPEDVEEPRQRGRPLGGALRPRRRRLPLVLPDRAAALGRLPLLGRDGRRVGAPVPADALEHLLLLGPLRERRGPCAGGLPLPRTRESKPTPGSTRSLLDRWALSRLQATIATVRERMDEFDCTAAGRAIAEYVEELSNWYVRLSRRRFWDGDRAAFAILRHCLLETAALLAPVHPLPRRRDPPQPRRRRARARRASSTTRSTCATTRGRPGARRPGAGGGDGGGAAHGRARAAPPAPRPRRRCASRCAAP